MILLVAALSGSICNLDRYADCAQDPQAIDPFAVCEALHNGEHITINRLRFSKHGEACETLNLRFAPDPDAEPAR